MLWACTWACMASSKEVKALLKLAKSSVASKNFEEVAKHCEAVFAIDPANYYGHVFAGLAVAELGQRETALRHYRAAITSNPEELLAWKGLADFYDKHRVCGKDEREEAIKAVDKSLQSTKESEHTKHDQLLGRLAKLHGEAGNKNEAVECYMKLLSSTDHSVAANLQLEGVLYLLQQQHGLTDGAWSLVEQLYDKIMESTEITTPSKTELRELYIQCSLEKLQALTVLDDTLYQQILTECLKSLNEKEEMEQGKNTVVNVLVKLKLWKQLLGLVCTGVIPVLEEQLDHVPEQCHSDHCKALRLLVQLCEKHSSVNKDDHDDYLSYSCEYLTVLAFASLRCHDYATTEQLALQGLKVVSSVPCFLSHKLEKFLKLCCCEALLFEGSVQQAVTIMNEVWDGGVDATSDQVVRMMVMVKLASDSIEEAEQALGLYHDQEGPMYQCLQGQILMSRKNFSEAQEKFSLAVKQCPDNGWYLLCLGRSQLLSSDNKKAAYSSLVKAAQLDPLNAQTFLLLGHYQMSVSKNTTRAVKCYRKALSLQPSLFEAAMALGDALRSLGDEEGAYEAYQIVTALPVSSETKTAWLRVGLYQHKEGLYDSAITSYLKVLHIDGNNHHVWECLGDVYLSRGSYGSALQSFSRAIELQPSSLYSCYRMAGIKHILGLHEEAISDYTILLDADSNYVPALKGRGESLLSLAKLALDDNFDNKAVDLISVALSDFTRAALLRPSFVCHWQLIGDCCLALHDVAAHLRVTVPAELCSNTGSTSSGDTQCVGKDELIRIAIRTYGHGLSLCDGASDSLWHNLGVAYYYLGQLENTGDSKMVDSLQMSIKLLKKAVSLAAKDPAHWNALGVVSAHKAVGQYPLAQHAFISSLTRDQQDSIVWSNLGCLYFIHSFVELAHRSFQNAQSCNPLSVQGWVGQALVAEQTQPNQAMDLFRHASELQYHSEAAAGHAHWICHTLTTIDPEVILSSSGDLNMTSHESMVQARDNAYKYASRHPDDPHMMNILGLLYEQEGLNIPAQQSFARAGAVLESSGQHELSIVSANNARILSKLGRHSEALQCYSELGDILDTPTALTRALGLYRANMFEEASIAYQGLLESALVDDQPDILLALAMTGCAKNDWEEAKSFLFKIIEISPHSLPGLISLAVYACYNNDMTLLRATLEQEVQLSVAGLFLHPSSCSALEAMVAILRDSGEEALSDHVQKLWEAIAFIQEYPPVPLPIQNLSMSLVDLQKGVHSFPSDIWSLAVLTSRLMTSKSVIGRPYLELLTSAAQLCVQEASTENTSPHIVDKNKHILSQLVLWCKEHL